MKALTVLTLALGFLFTSCEVERPPEYFLESIHILEIPAFSQDANEGGADRFADVYVELVDAAGNVLSASPYYPNADSADFPLVLQFDNLIELYDDDYFIDVYDFDEIQHGAPEFLGSVQFRGKTNTTTKYAQYNDPQLAGTLGVTIDIFVEYPN